MRTFGVHVARRPLDPHTIDLWSPSVRFCSTLLAEKTSLQDDGVQRRSRCESQSRTSSAVDANGTALHVVEPVTA